MNLELIRDYGLQIKFRLLIRKKGEIAMIGKEAVDATYIVRTQTPLGIFIFLLTIDLNDVQKQIALSMNQHPWSSGKFQQ